MKLIKARVTNFRSVEDSMEFEVGNLTCLVGKNEAGKTAILEALYGLRPFGDFKFDKTRDYPRRHLAKYNQRHENGKARVVETWWELSDSDIADINTRFCEGVVTGKVIEVSKGIGYDEKKWLVKVDEKKYLDFLVNKYTLNEDEKTPFQEKETTSEAAKAIDAIENLTEKQNQIRTTISEFRENKLTLAIIDFLSKRIPSFFYTSHYDRMSGEISVNKLSADKENKSISIGDQIFLNFLKYAGTDIEEMQNATQYEELKAKCEGASNDITDEIFKFWSQNDALSVKIDLGEGRSEDAPPFNSGTVVKIRIENRNHRVTVPLSERSAGFVWFFSFLSQFKQLQNTTGDAVILLDEPGLTLHGKAQSDLLRYIQERLLPNHQVIYSTHSPFMVPAERLADVRVVEDVVARDDNDKTVIRGTKVSSDVLMVDKDTLFPLQGHLGYEITQSLFIGKNTLLVEGPSDILYLQGLSEVLKSRSREGLDSAWTICPTGGIDKMHAFVSLFRGNDLTVAILSDFTRGDKKKIERLKESQILKSNQVHVISDFTNKNESDIEDIFHPDSYAEILNSSYNLSGNDQIDRKKLSESTPKTERLVKQAENIFRLFSKDVPEFDHFTPAYWFIQNLEVLRLDDLAANQTLDVAEKVFSAFNLILKGDDGTL